MSGTASGRALKLLSLVVLVFLFTGIASSTAFGDGSDGSITVTSTQVVNDYTYLTGDESLGSQTLNVNDGSAFSAGDEVMVYQVQNGTGNGRAGAYEFARVSSADSNSITLENGLSRAYYSGSFVDSPGSAGEVTQVVRVPHYSSVTIDGGVIEAAEWDGRTGGVVAFRVSNTLDFINGGKIDVRGQGFRGGLCGNCEDDWDGGRGEALTGWSQGGGAHDGACSGTPYQNNWIGGGGNEVNNNNGGGPAAGGGHATPGETVSQSQCSSYSYGGGTVGKDGLPTMFFGGGGGAGSDHDGLSPDRPEKSDGGGIVFVGAETVNNAEIVAEGIDGKTGNHRHSGNSGGGAGGTVWVRANSLDVSYITAKGGDRSPDAGDGERGGYGGDGRVRVDYASVSGLSNVQPSPYVGMVLSNPRPAEETGTSPATSENPELKLDVSSSSTVNVEFYNANGSAFSSGANLVQWDTNAGGGANSASELSNRMDEGGDVNSEKGRMTAGQIDCDGSSGGACDQFGSDSTYSTCVTGYIYVPESGTYSFATDSDDASD
ncbi:MAG: hypothetical protein SVS85_02765, partial [Candidatus Nanohaloarchaea archaeon]|nr:hypothetical protein [Candidatus Nanohaloarchaea archaeon]